MKKIISLILLVSFTLSLFAVPTSALASEQKFLLAKSFNGEVTGAAPDGAVAAGTAKVAVVSEGKDKAVELSRSKLESGILYTVTTSENNVNMFFEIEYKEMSEFE